ncbi:MAG: hypothetical protein IEMM0002_0850 [bacterium]|nr:MAG: hypothetical protein IEMM0002_0850 [bacterium]
MNSSLRNDPRYTRLFETNDDFRKLSDEHIQLKRESSEFNKAKYLNPEQMAKMHEIKKRKLEIKDKLESMMNLNVE